MKKELAIIASGIVLVTALCGCVSNQEKAVQNTYAEIKKEISIAENLEKDYFAQYYDLHDISTARDAAQDAINNSKEECYDEVLHDLSSENTKLSTYLDKEKEKLYNEQTTTDIAYEFPFEVSKSLLPQSWSFEPETKQSSAYPTWIVTYEPDTTDGSPTICFFINDQSPEFSYVINHIETKEINVMNENGEIQNALVNTELKCTVNDGYRDVNIPLNERPAYFVVCNDQVKLLLQSYEGEDYFIPYVQTS